MDGAQFAKMLSDKHLLELNRMEYKYSNLSASKNLPNCCGKTLLQPTAVD